MAEESYEELCDFFDNDKDLKSSVDINLNSDGSCLQPIEEENNVSHESIKVLTDIDSLLNESSKGSDVSDTEEQQIKGGKGSGDSTEATETLKAENAVAGPSVGKRKADDDLEDLEATGPIAKTSKLENDDGDIKNEGDEVDDRLLDGNDDGVVSFDQMADLLDQGKGESQDKEGNEPQEITQIQISQRLRELKLKYRDVLQKVCNIHGMTWQISRVDPIVHQDPDDETKILGIEELQEYVDNQHPLWGFDRIVNNPTFSLSDYVHTRWGNQNIDPRSSLSVLVGCDEEEKKEDLASNANKNLQPKSEHRPEIDLHKKAIKAIMEMDIEAISREVLEKEKERKKIYQQKVDPLFSPEQLDVNKVITLGSVPFDEFTQMIGEKAAKNNWSKRTEEEVIAGTQEAIEMASYYTGGDRGLSEDQVETILDMEEAYDKILELDRKAEDENKNTRDFMIKDFMRKDFLENA